MTQAYILPIHDLGRRPGASKEVTLDLPAPEDMRTGVVSIREDSPIHVDVRVVAASDGILVSGTISADAVAECVRCLDEIPVELHIDVAELYLLPEAVARAEEDGDEEAAEMLRIDGATLDLEPLLRDTLVPAMPYQPLCSEDCRGLCSTCGMRLDELPEDHHHEVIDPRFAALAALLETSDTEDLDGQEEQK